MFYQHNSATCPSPATFAIPDDSCCIRCKYPMFEVAGISLHPDDSGFECPHASLTDVVKMLLIAGRAAGHKFGPHTCVRVGMRLNVCSLTRVQVQRKGSLGYKGKPPQHYIRPRTCCTAARQQCDACPRVPLAFVTRAARTHSRESGGCASAQDGLSRAWFTFAGNTCRINAVSIKDNDDTPSNTANNQTGSKKLQQRCFEAVRHHRQEAANCKLSY